MSSHLPEWLTAANQEFARKYPGESGARQPVHTVYGGAHLFKAETCKKLGGLAERALTDYAADADAFAHVLGIPKPLATIVYGRIVEKLRREPIEDFRIDFEDGFGIRPDEEEDAAVDSSVAELAKGMAEGTLSPFIGFRVKPLSEELKGRSIRTLDRFLGELLDRTGGKLPPNFVVTLPKITLIEHVAAFVHVLAKYPRIGLEVMVETPQILFRLNEVVEAAKGHLVAAHLGPYDYTSTLGITSINQHLMHPALDLARWVMQNGLANTGISLSDGPTNIMPIPPHRAKQGEVLTDLQRAANVKVVHRAWNLHYTHVRHALSNGIYRGWDLHPAQLPMRYAALYTFFLEGLDAASARLRNFVQAAAQATRVGDVFDDAATGQGLLNYFLRAVSCGAVPESDVPGLTGLTLEQLHTGSFTQIMKMGV